ncbi:beta-1,4-mannosyltransferase [Fistulifera solaris]|uniref:Beta-1,4-mannosyltransferase n=1 Tax=Fistulifera solaris TaxID=1519565 RepID=A0A1Z5K4H1_FISSO|nr:beta-1,4-mannosyltransferase [Fistulifera solaris]|eukprot:GAX21133.1 beta-1,4-mannosyltransferase [Fistulifera solaris]
MHVVVAVLGDVGRSPRMQYHTMSLLEAGHDVTLLGYTGEDLIPALQENQERLRVVRFMPPSFLFLRKCLPIYFVSRILSLTLWLTWALFLSVPGVADCIIVQNPPAMPIMAICVLYCKLMSFWRGKRPAFIIDWHNLGYSMLNPGAVQKLARKYEQIMAPFADAHFTVTKAMKVFLQENMNIKTNSSIQVLYDCPPAMFQRISLAEQHSILMKLDKQLCQNCPREWTHSKDNSHQSLFTECCENNRYLPRLSRPALIVSSTSWTPDEDFGILLDALVIMDRHIETKRLDLRCLVVVTGKGPQKEMYEERISRLGMRHIAIQTVWLEPGDYPKLLACADLGISLHTSTSGLDLPMKILDMFGCGVPVCAVNFACLSELVEDDVNGRVFESSRELADLLVDLLGPLGSNSKDTRFPNHSFGDLDRYSKQLLGRRAWSENWNENAAGVIFSAVESLATR